MLIYFLGGVDIFCAIMLILQAFGYPFPHLQAVGGLLLGVKGVAFIDDFFSLLDVFIALGIFALLWFSFPILAIFMAIYLLCKGAYSFT
jgi:hypothetical protein